jgi:hypothetical protein
MLSAVRGLFTTSTPLMGQPYTGAARGRWRHSIDVR